MDEQPTPAAVVSVAFFQGSQASCRETMLVLEAQGIGNELVEFDGVWTVFVRPADLESARDEIRKYAAERSVVRQMPRPVVPFAGAGMAAALYCAMMMLVAYCAGNQMFGIDWFDAGALGGGDWWRPITALTLHVDQAHLLGNLLFGAGIGVLAGRLFGPGVAWASILAAGAIANYLDMLIAPSTHRAVGASTAIFAALGLMAGFSWRQRLPLKEQFRYRWAPLFAGVCLLALLGAGGEHVDVLGHVLGFLVGLAGGWMFARWHAVRERAFGAQASAGAVAAILPATAWWLALRHAAPL
jgi:rhomboid protease GluP